MHTDLREVEPTTHTHTHAHTHTHKHTHTDLHEVEPNKRNHRDAAIHDLGAFAFACECTDVSWVHMA